jgi:hypothetical protein
MIKGVGRIYLQSVVDAHCSLAFGKPYLSKVPMTAVDIPHGRVLPVYEEHGANVGHVHRQPGSGRGDRDCTGLAWRGSKEAP